MEETGFTFEYGPKVVSGSGSAARLGDHVRGSSVLFVTDEGVRRLGLADAPVESLRSSGAAIHLFDQVEADPSRATLEAAIELGRSNSVDAIVGFGGGSPMDVAKLAAYLLGSGDELDAIWGVGKATGRGLPLTLVPTTAGTGSEATAVSIITLPGDEKRGVNSPALYADLAILDPLLTIGLPRHVTAATGIDAMVHAIEAYTSRLRKNPVSDAFAREALRLLSANFRTVCDQPDDPSARGAMLLGAHLAGVAFANAPVAGVHALAYPLGGRFHVPHGLSNALVLPEVLRHNRGAAAPLYAELSSILRPDRPHSGQEQAAEMVIDEMVAMSRHAGLPQQLRDVGVNQGDLNWLATEAMKQDRLLVNNPCPISLEDARAIYARAL